MVKEELPLVSIIVPVFEQLEYTKRCLQCVEETIGKIINFEVIIVDDCSRDGTREYLKKVPSTYTVLFNSEKKGYAKNNNWAVTKAKGQYLCLLNNDVFVEGNWLQPMLDVFNNKNKVGVVGNVQKYVDSERFDHMGVVFGPQGNPRHYGQWFKKTAFTGEVKKWSAVTAACCVVEKEAFIKLGCFDEVYINGCEDVDLCLRFNRNGFENFVVHDSIVSHVKGASDGRKTYNDKNSQILQQRWGAQIKMKESVDDQVLHAKNYIYRGLVKPFSINIWKWMEAVLIYSRLKSL